jgi:gamma-glutamylcyclotransferase (GGCT)/AIG2-like uncharacterized protein YtfP
MKELNKLFVYGIFLDESMRNEYCMSNPYYTTVDDYITVGRGIVQAAYVKKDSGISLTGLVVDVDKDYWSALDQLEGAYDRVLVETYESEQVWMYVSPVRKK